MLLLKETMPCLVLVTTKMTFIIVFKRTFLLAEQFGHFQSEQFGSVFCRTNPRSLQNELLNMVERTIKYHFTSNSSSAKGGENCDKSYF